MLNTRSINTLQGEGFWLLIGDGRTFVTGNGALASFNFGGTALTGYSGQLETWNSLTDGPKTRWRASRGSAPVNRFTRAIKNNTTDTWHQTMPVGLPSAVAQALAGTLTMSGALASTVKFTVTLTGTLTMSGAVSGTYYPPVPDAFLTTLFRRNQTD